MQSLRRSTKNETTVTYERKSIRVTFPCHSIFHRNCTRANQSHAFWLHSKLHCDTENNSVHPPWSKIKPFATKNCQITNLHFHSNCLATVSINSGHNGPSFRPSCEVMLSSRLSPVRYNNFRIQTTISRDYVMLFRRVNILCTILNIF